MIVLIALLVGIYDVWALAGIFFMNAAMCWFGWMMEVNNQYTEKVDWTSYIMGCLVGITPWIFIFINLNQTIQNIYLHFVLNKLAFH